MYRQHFELLLPDGNGMYRTLVGSTLSVITLTMIIVYASFKISDLAEKSNYKVMTRELLEYYDLTESFGPDDGFMIAA